MDLLATIKVDPLIIAAAVISTVDIFDSFGKLFSLFQPPSACLPWSGKKPKHYREKMVLYMPKR
jgi:hypothetical protein